MVNDFERIQAVLAVQIEGNLLVFLYTYKLNVFK